jgi:hypothetical protein
MAQQVTGEAAAALTLPAPPVLVAAAAPAAVPAHAPGAVPALAATACVGTAAPTQAPSPAAAPAPLQIEAVKSKGDRISIRELNNELQAQGLIAESVYDAQLATILNE